MEFTLKTVLTASAQVIYETWLSSEGHTAMTGGVATASDKIGGSFKAWDGYINGKNITLEPHKRIVQSWRTSQFKDSEEDSQIEIMLDEQEGSTHLTLIHTKVPESGDHYRTGWGVHYFEHMQGYFSK